MTDLVQEFFLRDLSEAEHEALSKMLESTPDAALRYEQLLEQSYLATGLPQPSLPQGLQSLPHPGAGGLTGLSGSIKILLAVLATTGVILWKFWPQPKTEISVPVQPQAVQQTAPKALTVPVKEAIKLLAPVQPSAAAPGPEGQELSVVVDAPVKNLVTVRILGQDGQEIRNLYTGFVQPGHWAFRWDGDLTDGKPAPPGNYQIDVQTGTLHQTKNIRIKPN